MGASLVHGLKLKVQGGEARVFTGGESRRAVLLLHGGWGGAEMHWSRVWNDFATQARVIAPDLPGLGNLEQPGLLSVGAYVEWLNALLTELGVEEVLCVGNSFGASLAFSFAGRRPERCTGLVLVDGFAMPKTPAALRWLGNRAIGRTLMRTLMRRLSFSPRALCRAFANPRNAPEALTRSLEERSEQRLDTFVRVLISGDGPPEPSAPVLMVWGEEDHLPGTSLETGRRIGAQNPRAHFVSVSHAGHFPQLERPGVFVKEVTSFMDRSVHTRPSSPAPEP